LLCIYGSCAKFSAYRRTEDQPLLPAQNERDSRFVSRKFVLKLLLLFIYILRILQFIWFLHSWLPRTSKAIYGHAMSSNPFIFLLCVSDTKARESWRIESQFMKNWIWWHPLLNHVRNHFETWQICIVFRRLVVFRSPLQGKGWFFVSSFFLQLAGLFLNFVINGDMRCGI
jgi:hypothetical protein